MSDSQLQLPVMKRFLLVLLLIGAPMLRAAEPSPVTFYIQLVCGSDSDTPPTPDAKLAGPKLDARLHGVFRWKNYWEVNREAVTLKPGGKIRRRVNAQKDIELAWPSGRQMTVCLYTNGKLTRKQDQSIDASFYIAGGDLTGSESWFVIVAPGQSRRPPGRGAEARGHAVKAVAVYPLADDGAASGILME